MKLGYRLTMCGAETFRVEESITRLMNAYGVNAETFAIPNVLIINIETPDGQTLTRMRRIGYHGSDLDAVEQYSNLSRKLCAEVPAPEEALQRIHQTDASRRTYRLPLLLAGHFLGACGFSVFFGGGWVDSLCAGICGVVIGLVNRFTDKLRVNPFFSTTAAAFLMTLVAYIIGTLGIPASTDGVIIGALMLLVPGLLITNAMRDIIFGDTNSGINRIVQVLLIAVAIAVGTGSAWNLSKLLWNVPSSPVQHSWPLWMQCISTLLGCIGFGMVFNIHGPGLLLCAAGGVLTWGTYGISYSLCGNEVVAYLIAAIIASIYAESMARIRKYPAISYLLVAAFPLLPGAGIYYTTNHLVSGDFRAFVNTGLQTAAIAGALAVGILFVSTTVRLWGIWKNQRHTINHFD